MITLLTLSLALAQDPAPADAETTEETAAEAPAGPDRSAPPEVVASSPLELSDPEVHKLHDGVTVHFVPLDNVRKVQISVNAWRGSMDVGGDMSWSGRAVGELMDMATTSRDAEAIELLGAMHDLSVWSTGTGAHQQGLYLEVPLADLAIGLDLLGDVLRNPAYPGKELKRYRKESSFYWTAVAPTDLGTLASSARGAAWYPADHPFGKRRDLAELADVKPAVLAERSAQLWQESPIDILVVGDLTWSDVEEPLTAMFEGLGSPGERNYVPTFDGAKASSIVAVDLPGEQAAVRLRMAGPRFDHADKLAAELVDYALGGHFLSRLNKNLREDKGFTYGSRSYLYAGRSAGVWDISVDVKAENVTAAMTEIENELAALVASGVEPGEIGSAVRETVQSWNRTRLTAETADRLYERLLDEELTAAEARAQLLSTAEISVEETQRVASEWLGTDAPRLWVIVGDRSALEAPLAEVGLPVKWISPEDAVFGRF